MRQGELSKLMESCKLDGKELCVTLTDIAIMSGFFRRFFLGDFGPPPLPDLSHRPSIAGQNIVEILYSDSKRLRAIVTQDASGIYRVHVQIWDTSDWKSGHGAFWYGDGSNSFTDNLEQARKLACDELRLANPGEVA